MKQNRLLKVIVISAIVISLVIVALLFFENQKNRVKYDMTAYLVTADGAVEDTFAFEIRGCIRERKELSYLDINVDVPEDFRYKFREAESYGNACYNRWAFHPGDYATQGYTYDRIGNEPALCSWALNIEKGYFIAYWGEAYGRYLIASVDSSAGPEDIMEHFQLFLDNNRFE